MTKTIEQLALEAGFSVESGLIFANSEMGPSHSLCTKAITHFANLVRSEYRAELLAGSEEPWLYRHEDIFGNLLGTTPYYTADQLAAAVLRYKTDAERYRWLREQHECLTELDYDAEGMPMPREPVRLAFTVFKPDYGSLEPIGCMEGELDAAIDAARGANDANK